MTYKLNLFTRASYIIDFPFVVFIWISPKKKQFNLDMGREFFLFFTCINTYWQIIRQSLIISSN